MNSRNWWAPVALLASLCAPAAATVTIKSLKSTIASPQPVGAIVGWSVSATDTNAGPLTFQFNVAPPNGTLSTVKNFNVGILKGNAWISLPFTWALTAIDGTYLVQVVVKDFGSGETASKTVSFQVTSPITDANPVVQKTQNPLVALFTAPPCAAGSTVAVVFQPQSGSVPATTTNWLPCQGSLSVSFEIAGMYPNTAYNLYAQVNTGGDIVNGPAVAFTTGALPTNLPFPKFSVVTPAAAGDSNPILLQALSDLEQPAPLVNVATDLSGNIIWYNYPNDPGHSGMITRPLVNGFLADQSGVVWNPAEQGYQVLRQFDWAGNIVRETNTGIVQQQLLAMGDPNAGPCNTIPSPPPIGAACLGIFHHDAIQSLPNGYTAALADIEKIFPPGTQGDTSGLPVDVVGDIIVVLDQNWNVVWYWDAFDPADGNNGYPQLPVSRTAVLGETCTANGGCLVNFLAGPGVAPSAHDWLHSNTLYYWPHNGAAAPSDAPGDLIWSSRHQDWVIRIDYQDGAGTGNIVWRMGPSGDFAFVNTYNDPWPWFSHQHDAGIEGGGTGVFDTLDNGNTRISPPTGPRSSTGGVPGLGVGCLPNDCATRGIALTFDEAAMQVYPVMNVNLGTFSQAMGSAQLLDDGNYFFQSAFVLRNKTETSYNIEIQPVPGTATGPQVLNLAGPAAYRAWQMPSLYSPPGT